MPNLRIEFFGGPRDGEVSYQATPPPDNIYIAQIEPTPAFFEDGLRLEFHHYKLFKITDIEYRYEYQGMSVKGN